jgi:hypothetical protein
MRVAIHHLLAAVPYPLLDDSHWRSRHDLRAHSMVPEAVHTATYQPKFAKQWMKVLVQNDAIHEWRTPFR